MALKGLAALRQKVVASTEDEAPVVREKPAPSRSQVERHGRIRAAVEQEVQNLPHGVEVEVEYGRLFVRRFPFWEIVVNHDCEVAAVFPHTRKANSQGLTDTGVLEAVRGFVAATGECSMMLEVVLRAKAGG
jgi:hypothetical protein